MPPLHRVRLPGPPHLRARFVALAWFAVVLAGSLPVGAAGPAQEAPKWQAGAAVVDITPEGPMWLAGYAFRKKPSEGISQRLHAKALALQDERGTRMVIVTMDLIAVPRPLREAVALRATERHGLPPEALLLNASHTHSGPAPYRRGVSDPAYVARAEAYGKALEEKLLGIVAQALERLEPAQLFYTHARAGFAMNRRLRLGQEIRNSPNPDGPIDHDVPVLRIATPAGALRAVLFGYACHNTTTGFYTINGDYAGFAQAYLEEAHPGAVALFMIGAGGDQNPYPRSVSLEQAAQHGRTLAHAVEAALGVVVQRRIEGPLRRALGYAELAYAETSPEALRRRATLRDPAERSRAEELLQQLATEGALPASYPCPVQVVQLGREVVLVAIGGEATVEYSLRLKRELGDGPAAVWVAGYSNDGFGYLGSRRVLEEGGYEGRSANLARHPGPWALTTEDRVIAQAHELIRSLDRRATP